MQFMLNRKDLFIYVTDCTYGADVAYPEHIVRQNSKSNNLVDTGVSGVSACMRPWPHGMPFGKSCIRPYYQRTETVYIVDNSFIQNCVA